MPLSSKSFLSFGFPHHNPYVFQFTQYVSNVGPGFDKLYIGW